ncbi:MAG: HAMP domain-containing histidine kinase [Acidimicrobiia bacterium]|nr:HAMP domain-containing histidine kinase [Acidimicrobiia bacterium]
MPRHFGPGGPQHWRSHGGRSWPPAGEAAQAWQGFGRRMFLGGLIFFGIFLAAVVAMTVFVVSAISDWSGLPFILVVIGVILVGRSFIRSWRPVRRLIRAAGALADGDYSARVAPSGSRSMRAVVSSFNDMARQLETSDEQRRRLLADLGHELRTPLTVVRGEIEAMLDGVHEIDADHLELLMNEVMVMERLLEDLRTLSLIDAGRLDLHPEPTDLSGLVDDVADGYRRRAGERGVSVAVEATGDLDELLLDPVRIREVLTNLTVNALRAMPEGGLLRFVVTPAGLGAVVEVVDSGSGIDASELEQVFDRFHKGSSSGGSGLGLTISRDLVEAHGGTLSLESEPGVGTTVRVELPNRVVPA